MEDQYGISDLRQYINGRSIFQPIVQPPPDLLSGHDSLTPVLHQYTDQMSLVGHQMTEMVPRPPGSGFHPEFRTDSATTGVNVTCGLSSGGCFEMDAGGFAAGDGGTGRWPRQETLTLLEIRSKLDSKFKEANHKGPLWDEVSRILSEEHGYQRSGKKCREKFENLYKYYKKTKDGKAGRQDGKHYRFFRQLEALYGETSNNNASSFSNNNLIASSFPYHNPSLASNQESLQTSKITDSLSHSNSSDFYSTSSEDATVENDSCEKRRKRKGKKNWKAKIKDFIDLQMRKLTEKQDVWMEKMMKNIEDKEKERIKREEDWKKEENERIEREQKFWANERAWIEARDASLMDCLRKATGKELPEHPIGEGILESVPTSTKRDRINEFLIMGSGNKRKEDSRISCYVTNECVSMENGSYSCSGNNRWDGPPPADGGGAGGAMPYGGYRYLLGDCGNLWMNNGVKFNNGDNCPG